MAEKTTKSSMTVADSGQTLYLEVVPEHSAVELMLQAATALEMKKGPRALKTYQLLAAEVRALAQRISEMG